MWLPKLALEPSLALVLPTTRQFLPALDTFSVVRHFLLFLDIRFLPPDLTDVDKAGQRPRPSGY